MLNDGARATGYSTHYEIVNAGVNAYNLDQAYNYMRRIEERYQPQGFLVAYTVNDRWNRFGSLDEEPRAQVLNAVSMKNVLRESALYNWLIEIKGR